MSPRAAANESIQGAAEAEFSPEAAVLPWISLEPNRSVTYPGFVDLKRGPHMHLQPLKPETRPTNVCRTL